MTNDLDLKDAIATLVAIQDRTKRCREAVERSAKAQGISAAFLLNGADRELEALSVAIACLLLARGKTEEAKETFFGQTGAKLPDDPKPAPTSPLPPFPKGAEVESPPTLKPGTLAIPRRSRQSEISF